MRLRREAAEAKVRQLEAIIAHRKNLKENICRDYFDERHRVKEEQKPDSTLRDKLLLAQEVLKQQLESEKRKLEHETSYKADVLRQKTEDYNTRFRGQA